MRSGATIVLRVATRQFRRSAHQQQPPPPLASNRQAHPSHPRTEAPHSTAPPAAPPAGAPEDPHRARSGTMMMALLAVRAVREHPASAAACILALALALLSLAHVLALTTAGGVVYFAVGDHVASPDVLFGSMPTTDFVAGFADFDIPDAAKQCLESYPTLGCLRMMGPEDEDGEKTATTQEVWASFCRRHKLPSAFKRAAAEHVVVERAVDNFFAWKGVTWSLGPFTWAKLDAGERRRALRLLQGDIVHSVGEDSGSHELMLDVVFAEFCKQCPEWADPSQSWVFFRDHEKVKALSAEGRAKLKITRVQRHSGLCHMHAPAAVQHSLVTLNSRGEHHGMLNVAKYIAKCYDADQVYAHVVEGRGGSSVAFLQRIMGLEGDIRKRSLTMGNDRVRKQQAERLVQDMEKYGVGLVSEFEVEPAFRGKDVSFMSNTLETYELLNLHAMTLVGHREKDGRHIFLLQNWWQRKQFVEVSEEYLDASMAWITFVTKEMTEIPKDLPTNDNVFSMETEDVREQQPLEILRQ